MEYYRLYGFWAAIGVAVLLSVVGYFVATAPIKAEVRELNEKLESTFESVKKLSSPTEPNEGMIAEVSKQQEAVAGRLAKVSDELSGRQEKSLKWMAAVRGRIPPPPLEIDRPVCITFKTRYDEEVERVVRTVEPISEENPTGKVYFDISAIKVYSFGAGTPTSADLRLAQEDLWIQEAILKVIAAANADAPSFYDSVVKRIDQITIGGEALDARMAAKHSGAVGGGGGEPGMGGGFVADAPGGGAGGGGGAKGQRYFDETDNYKIIPVSLELVVDPLKLPKLFQKLAEADLSLLVSQVSFMKVDGLPMPTIGELRRGGLGSVSRVRSSRRNDAGGEPAMADAAGGGPMGRSEGAGQSSDDDSDTPDLLGVKIHLRLYWYKRSKAAQDKLVKQWQEAKKAEEEKAKAAEKAEAAAPDATKSQAPPAGEPKAGADAKERRPEAEKKAAPGAASKPAAEAGAGSKDTTKEAASAGGPK